MTILSSSAGEIVVLRGLGPLDVMARWPEGIRSAWLAGSGDARRARWTILGIPSGEVERNDPMRVLDRVGGGVGRGLDGGGLPFAGGWIGWLSYEFGEVIEPTVARGGGVGPRDDRGWPVCYLARCDAALVHDARTGVWRAGGDAVRCEEVARMVASSARREGEWGFRVGALTSVSGRARYERDVARVVELIHAGDAFQVNLAHRLSGVFGGCARSMFVEVARALEPWYGAFVEMGDAGGGGDGLEGAVCSVSPELFLRVEGVTGRVETRPMKGTRPAGARGAEQLRGSEKDRAELAMIVDLMRNDLGRVCAYGSVRVEDAQAVELHHGLDTKGGGVMQGVATVSGVLREGMGIGDVIRASFSPGSVTGAPKVRAMQIIRGLEPVVRGPYCGAVGYVSDGGNAQWSVAIRTAGLRFGAGSSVRDAHGTIDYAVGAGIVADSCPRAEWRETLVKASAFRRTVRGRRGG